MELAINPTPAPALSRGLALLQQLGADGHASLEALTQVTGWPKSSVLRILQSLELAGAVRRDPVTRRFHPQMRLVPVETQARSLTQRLGPTMDVLCRETRVTVELYAWRDAGLTMIDRREPVDAEVCVRARVGHVRDLREIEALSQVARAWPLTGVPPAAELPRRRLWAWDAGTRRRLTVAQLKSAITQAREQRVGIDLGVNENNVRRYACPVACAPGPAQPRQYEAVLALAEVCPPTAKRPAQHLADQLQQAAARVPIS